MLTVQKYGGSSVASINKIIKIANRLKKLKQQGQDLVVVVSAMGKTTNKLIKKAQKITNNPNLKELDMLLSTGELQSVSLLAIALNNLGVKATALSGWQAGITTTNNFSRAFIKNIDKDNITNLVKEGYIVIVAGFQGVTLDGQITTLGRGGSDTTAVALAASLSCPCEIYTDVEGIYKVDPRLYKNAKKLKTISYDEMLELAINGAKVLETRSVELAKIYNIKLYLAKTLETKKRGTYVMDRQKNFEDMKISGMGVKEEVNLITFKMPAFYEQENELLNLLANTFQNFEMFNKVRTLKNTFLFLSTKESVEELKKEIKTNKLFSKIKITVKSNLIRVALVGTGLSSNKYFVKKVIELLNQNKIDTYQMLLNETAIIFVTDKTNKQTAIDILAKEFEL